MESGTPACASRICWTNLANRSNNLVKSRKQLGGSLSRPARLRPSSLLIIPIQREIVNRPSGRLSSRANQDGPRWLQSYHHAAGPILTTFPWRLKSVSLRNRNNEVRGCRTYQFTLPYIRVVLYLRLRGESLKVAKARPEPDNDTPCA